MPPVDAGILTFHCNICGAGCAFAREQLARETVSCTACNSTPRTRAVVHALGYRLFGADLLLPDFPEHPELTGLGMTDSNNYATRLSQKFNYQNTYLHQAPFLDISSELAPERRESCDFVIASEVFEHVQPPVLRAFANVLTLLKPGGVFVLTVPWGLADQNTEHFPNLHRFTVTEQENRFTLTNITREGKTETFTDLIFHGGPGSTLEMRLFSEAGLVHCLTEAGFSEIEVHRQPCLKFGIFWPQAWSWPISARKPL